MRTGDTTSECNLDSYLFGIQSFSLRGVQAPRAFHSSYDEKFCWLGTLKTRLSHSNTRNTMLSLTWAHITRISDYKQHFFDWNPLNSRRGRFRVRWQQPKEKKPRIVTSGAPHTAVQSFTQKLLSAPCHLSTLACTEQKGKGTYRAKKMYSPWQMANATKLIKPGLPEGSETSGNNHCSHLVAISRTQKATTQKRYHTLSPLHNQLQIKASVCLPSYQRPSQQSAYWRLRPKDSLLRLFRSANHHPQGLYKQWISSNSGLIAPHSFEQTHSACSRNYIQNWISSSQATPSPKHCPDMEQNLTIQANPNCHSLTLGKVTLLSHHIRIQMGSVRLMGGMCQLRVLTAHPANFCTTGE